MRIEAAQFDLRCGCGEWIGVVFGDDIKRDAVIQCYACAAAVEAEQILSDEVARWRDGSA